MLLYNTKSRTIEEFIPHDSKKVKLYTCGPTVYSYAHIGNLRCYIMEDILEKSLRYLGFNVKRAMNITDVGHLSSDSDTGEDKMVKGAIKEHKSVLELAKFYTDKFFDDCAKLNIKKPEIVVPATTCIPLYIDMITRLLEKGYAYFSNGNVYFDTSKLKEYYVLSNHNEEELIVGAREDVSLDENKKNKADFVLWFTKSKFADQELKWESPWGLGYPGWHIECSCIALKYLGEYLDIHCGGVDNIFPHHTNEIAQTESYIGHPWCKYWYHVEHLNDQNGKMSKSKGGTLTVDTLIKEGYDPLAYRFFCLQSHYRNQLVFSNESLNSASNAYQKLKNKIFQIKEEGIIDEKQVKKYQDLFKNNLENDLNIAEALTTLYAVIKDNDLSGKSKIFLIKDFDQVLSLSLLENKKAEVSEELLNYINSEIERRNIAKKNKNYALADEIRESLKGKNIIIKDTREGTTFEIIK